LAYAIQLENIFEADSSQKTMPVKQMPTQIAPPDSNDYLTKEEIILLLKEGQPVEEFVNFYIALNPAEIGELETLLSNEVSSQSILINVQEFLYQYQQPKPRVVEEDFTIDYFDPEDEEEEYNEEFYYED